MGDEAAVEKLFHRFFDRLRSVARKRVSVRDRKVGESIFEDQNQSRVLERVCLEKVDFELVVDFFDVLDVIVDRLKDPELGEILAAKFAGNTSQEIAQLIGRSVSSVDRKLRLIRNVIVEDRDIEVWPSTDLD